MATLTHFYTLHHAAELLGEDPDLLEAITENEDNLTCGNLVQVLDMQEDYVTALTDDGIEELKDMLAQARMSETDWLSFLNDFVADLNIINRVKVQRLR